MKKLKKISLIILLFSLVIPNIFHAQCTNSTIMCSSITTENDSVCTQGNIDIEIVGGFLGVDSKWELFVGSCGGTLIATTQTNSFLKANDNFKLYNFELKNSNEECSKLIKNNVMITLPNIIHNHNIDGYFAAYLKKIR